MTQCQSIYRKRKKVCIGDKDTLITIQNRSIKAPTDGVDFDEEFSAVGKYWALHDRPGNSTLFDGTNTEVVVTDRFYIEYDARVTTESWIELDGNKYDIVASPLDIDGTKTDMLLNCVLRGPKTKKVNLS